MEENRSLLEDAGLSAHLGTRAVPQPFSPVQFLLGTYDHAITACGKGDPEEARTAILDLMLSMNLPHTRSSVRLFHLLEFCLSRLDNHDCQEVKEILKVIKEAWLSFSNLRVCPAGRV
jgi:hypothetical protein